MELTLYSRAGTGAGSGSGRFLTIFETSAPAGVWEKSAGVITIVSFIIILFFYTYVMKLALMRHLFSWRGCAFTRYGARAPRTSSTYVETSCWTRVHSACTRACPFVPLLYLRRGFVSVRLVCVHN